MLFKLPNVPTEKNLIDHAFSRAGKEAAKIMSAKGKRDAKIRNANLARIRTASAIIEGDLNAVIKQFPSYELLPDFYRKLLDIKINKDTYKKNLGALQWALKKTRQLSKDSLKAARNDRDEAKRFFGRTASVIKQISGELDQLVEIKRTLVNFPLMEDAKTLVVAGYPNVGKSTFVKTLTGSKVKIAAYPFTTQNLLVGHKMMKYERVQIVDSPGLLERPNERRNPIERQAMLAIQELADAVLFIVDPAQELESQLSLLKEIRSLFGNIRVVINKADVAQARDMDAAGKAFAEFEPVKISARNTEDCQKVFESVFKVPR